MIKSYYFVTMMLLFGCGGSLSDEQRKKLHDGMEEQKIIKLSDSEVVTASMEHGRVIYQAMELGKFEPLAIDSIEDLYRARIKLITPGADGALDVENQLIEAYVVAAETGSVPDNIQKLQMTDDPQKYDSLLYTRPKVTPLPDGAVKVEGIWNIYIAKKDVILSLDEK